MGHRLRITESDQDLIKSWYDDAKSMDTQNLPEFIENLLSKYDHDYGTICHALAAGAIATCCAINDSDQGGITGFQAGAVMWEFIKHWSYTNNKCGMRLYDWDHLLYPQYEDEFKKTISLNTWETLQEEAKKNLSDTDRQELVSPRVIAHWESIAAGNIPFGFVVKD